MEEDLNKCLEVLREGGIILYPTDTVWGIGCDATNPHAVEKIYRLKQRSHSQSMLVLLENENRLDSYVEDVPEIAYSLIEVSDKPLTIVYEGARNLAENLISEDGTIGIRIVRNPFCEALLQRFRKPVVSTSANVHGQPTPQSFSQIQDEIKNGVDYVVGFSQEDETPHSPSSVIRLGKGGEVKILRK